MLNIAWEKVFRVFGSRKWRLPVIGLSLAFVFASLALLPQVKKDTSISAFLAKDNPAIVATDKVTEVFALRSPIVIAVVAKGPHGIFEPNTLTDVKWLTDTIKKAPNIDPDRVRSLSSVTQIAGEGDRLIIEPLMSSPPTTQAEATAIERAARAMEPYRGFLFAQDGTATLIIAEMIDEKKGAQTYELLSELVKKAPHGSEVYVGGVGAAGGFLSDYLNRDTVRMVPLGLIATFIIMALAFRTVTGIVLPFMIVAPSVIGTIALMAIMDVPYYVLSNALPPVLIAIAVTDALHVMHFYYVERAHFPRARRGPLAARAIMQVWRPIVLTELTTVIGFFGNAVSASAPPMVWFSIFAMIGVTASVIGTVILIPAGFAAFGRDQSPPFVKARGREINDTAVRIVTFISRTACQHPGVTVAVALLVTVVGAAGIMRVNVDSDLMDQFQWNEPIRVADRVINERLAGTNYIDVVFETKERDGMLEPARLAKAEALQNYLLSLPHVGGVSSIIGYLKQMNMALNDGTPFSFVLPNSADAVAQTLFLLTASSSPTEWSDKIDSEQRRVLIRAYVNSGHFSDQRPIVEAVRQFIAEKATQPDMTVTMSGSLVVGYNWLSTLADEHVLSVFITLFLVFVVDALLFRSVLLGLLTLVPVVAAIMLIYSAMGFLGVPLDAATSMFAGISIGLGVDFSVHTLNWILRYMKEGYSLDEAVERVYPNSGRAQFFNFAIFCAAFGIVGVSQLPTMQRFGLLVALAIFASFLSAITLIPAILKLFGYTPEMAQKTGGDPIGHPAAEPPRRRRKRAPIAPEAVPGVSGHGPP